jgi:hypothetical protein
MNDSSYIIPEAVNDARLASLVTEEMDILPRRCAVVRSESLAQ